MMNRINTKLVKAVLLSKLMKLRRGYQEVAYKQWIIQPKETQFNRKAIYFEDNINNVVATQEETSMELEMEKILGGRREHRATVAYALKGMELIDGHVYGQGIVHYVANQKYKLLVEKNKSYFDEGVLSSSSHGNIYFGHWMSDDLTLALAAESLGPIFHTRRHDYTHEDEYLKLFSMRQNCIQYASFNNLILLDDVGQNSNKRLRYQILRDRVSGLPREGNEKIFIRRGVSAARASRSLKNAEEVEGYLSKQGFRIVDPDKLSAIEIVRATLGAKIVVGVEGSHMAHALYTLAETGSILMLQPPYRFNNVFKDYTDCLEQNYAFLVGDQIDGGFTIDLNKLAPLIDRCLNAAH